MAWDADAYARNAGFVPALGQAVFEQLAAQAGEHVLDLGCGDGVLTRRLMDAGAIVTAVDTSAQMVAAAVARGVPAQVMDGQALGFAGGRFDAVFSNAALHWMRDDPDAVLTGVHRVLRPGGRFVAEMGGAGNIAAIRAALHAALRARGIDPLPLDPWYFPSVEGYRRRLERAGFTVRSIEAFCRPTPLPGDVTEWLTTMAGAFLSVVGDRTALLDELRAVLAPALCDEDGRWSADYVRLRFEAWR